MQTVQFVKLKNAHRCKGFGESRGLSEGQETGVADEPMKKTSLINQLLDNTGARLHL